MDLVRGWSPDEEKVFADMGLEDNLKQEVHLATFLSCWLCIFVFPGRKGSYIRPRTFKIASRMARGDVFSLVVPVLASIYNGLNQISSSVDPGRSDVVFPIHYVYAWLGEYFGVYHPSFEIKGLARMTQLAVEGMAKCYNELKAHDLLRAKRHVPLSSTIIIKDECTVLVDDMHLAIRLFEYFTSLRSSYLTLRCEDLHIVEPYSPHRFSRQFGYVQDVPGNLSEDICLCTYTALAELWRSCLKFDTKCRIVLPSRSDVKGP